MSSNWHVDYEDSRKADGIILLGYGDYSTQRVRLDQLVEQEVLFQEAERRKVVEFARREGIPVDRPWAELTRAQQERVL